MYYHDTRPPTVFFAKCSHCDWESENFLYYSDVPCNCVDCGHETEVCEDIPE